MKNKDKISNDSVMNKISLAQFVSTKREKLGFSQYGFAKRANLPLEMVESIEAGQDLFLATTIRQKLAKALKIDAKNIKEYEKKDDSKIIPIENIEKIKIMILSGETSELKCPTCKEKLICRIAEMYDLEDNLIRHPKARCSKCPFQIS